MGLRVVRVSVSACAGACGEVIVRDSVGIWQRGGFGTAPHADCHSAGLRDSLCRWEVSLIRALIGLTKLITSISEFLKAMRGDAGAREEQSLAAVVIHYSVAPGDREQAKPPPAKQATK
ncbi:hypothetical protein QQF64_000742, partial [Cirrhinus molitorella]